MSDISVKSLLTSDDPLSSEAIKFLITCKDENSHIDYKETFLNDDKHWLDLTKDLMAFANTSGGFIIYGIRDSDFSLIGLSDAVIKILRNTNLIMQKANRNVAPAFTQIRSVEYNYDGNTFVFLHIPKSKGKTHIVIKEGIITFPSGDKKTILYPGMIYIRRSSTNAILTPDDFEYIINTRIDEFKDILLNRITKIVDAPPNHDVLVFDPTTPSEEGKRYVISDAPDASPVKGMSFTVSPSTDLEEISGWIAFLGRDKKFQPNVERLWAIYANRKNLKLSKKQKLELIRFNLLQNVPVFFWMKNLLATELKEIFERALKDCEDFQTRAKILQVSRFLSFSFAKKLIDTLGKSADRLSRRTKDFTIKNPRSFFDERTIEIFKKNFVKNSLQNLNELVENKLTQITLELSKEQYSVHKVSDSWAFDCYLYAQDDKYLNNK